MMIINPAEKLSGTVTAPASKSYAQRAIAIAALAKGTSVLRNMTLCNDIIAALDVIRRLGAEVKADGNTYTIKGDIYPERDLVLDIGESGLSARMFTVISALFDNVVTITGHGSILQRPFGNVEDPLNALGVDVFTNNGYLPITVKGILKGGEAVVDGSGGSQFLTGLLMSLPLVKGDSTVKVKNLKSIPYIDMTLRAIEDFGGKITNLNYETFFINGGQSYKAREYNMEGDWSGAANMLVAGVLCGGKEGVRVNNLNRHSKQADTAILKVLEYAGAQIAVDEKSVTAYRSETKGFTFNATHCPDLFPAIVALAACSKGETTIIGTSRLSSKESDRAEVLKKVYGQLGIEIDLSQNDIMTVKGGKIRGGVTVDSHNDHRIAMSAAVAALRADKPVKITGEDAVNKSYCAFWHDLESLGK